MSCKKNVKPSFDDCPMPSKLEIPKICFRHKNQYVDLKCDAGPIRVPQPKCITEYAHIEQPKLEIGPCELPKICYNERIIEKPKICVTESKHEICKPCIEYRPCKMLTSKACRVNVDIVKPCVKPMKLPKICCDPCPVTIPKVKVRPVKCCVPKLTCEPLRVDRLKFCDKPVNVEMPKMCAKPEPIKVPIPIFDAIKLADCPADCPKPC